MIEKHIYDLHKFCKPKPQEQGSMSDLSMASIVSSRQLLLETHVKLLIEFASKISSLNIRKYRFVMQVNLSSQGLVRGNVNQSMSSVADIETIRQATREQSFDQPINMSASLDDINLESLDHTMNRLSLDSSANDLVEKALPKPNSVRQSVALQMLSLLNETKPGLIEIDQAS